MIFQGPIIALNPVMTNGSQIDEAFCFHEKMPRRDRRERALQLLRDVQLPVPGQSLKAYLDEPSGGQRRRAMIAMALALAPKIPIADEPTTAPPVAEINQDVAPSHFTRPANFFGLCALSLQKGMSPSGLPTSLQIMARPFGEEMALSIDAA